MDHVPLTGWVGSSSLKVKKRLMEGVQRGRHTFTIYVLCSVLGFMTAVKQTYSRDYKIAIDTLVVDCEIMSFDPTAIKSSPKDGRWKE